MFYELVVQDSVMDSVQHREDFKIRFEQVVNAVLEEAPSDSAACSYFKKATEGISGILNICSSEGKFQAHAIHKSVEEVVKRLVDQIRYQLDQWRRNRFQSSEDSTLDASYDEGQKIWDIYTSRTFRQDSKELGMRVMAG